MRTNLLICTLSFFGVCLPAPAVAVQGFLTTTVSRVLVSGDDAYGGCMAALGAAISTATNTPNCPSTWVSFSCDGTYTSKDMAFHLLDQAQLALALNKKIYVGVDDTKKHGRYCFAYRLDVLK